MGRVSIALAMVVFVVSTSASARVGVVHRRSHVRKAPAPEGAPVTAVQPGDHVDFESSTLKSGYYRIRTRNHEQGYIWYRNVVPVETAPSTRPSLAHNRGEPVNKPFDGCGPAGSGGDTATDILKNRVDVPADYKPVALRDIVGLPAPSPLPKSRTKWTAAQHASVSEYEGVPIQVEGYLYNVKPEGPESANCGASDAAHVDWHMWLISEAGADRTTALVVEVTPRVRAMNSAWQLNSVRPLAKNRTHVRISGWLMMDPLHPEQLGKTRGTLWEIHPITRIEVQQGEAWVDIAGAVAGGSH